MVTTYKDNLEYTLDLTFLECKTGGKYKVAMNLSDDCKKLELKKYNNITCSDKLVLDKMLKQISEIIVGDNYVG